MEVDVGEVKVGEVVEVGWVGVSMGDIRCGVETVIPEPAAEGDMDSMSGAGRTCKAGVVVAAVVEEEIDTCEGLRFSEKIGQVAAGIENFE